ncbi:hypothetical protein L227DRAFT_483038, partial [Lentinus tigrinus ALCF2SS1-6]
VTICTFLVVALNLLYHSTKPACRFTLKLLRAIVGVFQPGSTNIGEGNICEHIPANLSTALQRFNIEPDCVTYACCPKCFALYPPSN